MKSTDLGIQRWNQLIGATIVAPRALPAALQARPGASTFHFLARLGILRAQHRAVACVLRAGRARRRS
eukprot:7508255-Pyramimonas_sp.AAC.1